MPGAGAALPAPAASAVTARERGRRSSERRPRRAAHSPPRPPAHAHTHTHRQTDRQTDTQRRRDGCRSASRAGPRTPALRGGGSGRGCPQRPSRSRAGRHRDQPGNGLKLCQGKFSHKRHLPSNQLCDGLRPTDTPDASTGAAEGRGLTAPSREPAPLQNHSRVRIFCLLCNCIFPCGDTGLLPLVCSLCLSDTGLLPSSL
ncbi:uncharacterized protein LOC119698738 [Motacilla alba alba]|uniref:uncharacterized protein LOC119698738 n=1 Tax=Motacilla alba alba TaxID=1094192 RepID=UPI0018D58FA3|nr:uncharacterized protein LOC119698738 [Motacilla alba alba]